MVKSTPKGTPPSPTALPTLIVRPGEADRIVAGHPWVYEGSLLRQTQPATDGELVQLKDHRQRFLGVGLYNGQSRIRVRMLSPERIDLDAAFFKERILAAAEHRKRFLPHATSFRLVNAESDFLSGLIVDRYEDVFVLQTSSLGMDQRKELISSVLQECFDPKAIVERNDAAGRRFEKLPETHGVLHGTAPGTVPIRLNGLTFTVDLSAGHKTGLYLDQQQNYARTAELIRPGSQVLDCFTFMGGFALHAARAGAAQVHGLDQSAEAVASATAGAKANGLDSRCTFEAANVFDWLKAKTAKGPNEKLIAPFDAIILDPPSFTRSRDTVNDALRGYKEIHLRALKLLRRGGLLATFCCSHHVDSRLFMDVILSAAFDARRVLRRVAVFDQSPDHPVVPSIPETEYLKGFAFEVVQ